MISIINQNQEKYFIDSDITWHTKQTFPSAFNLKSVFLKLQKNDFLPFASTVCVFILH